MENVYTNFRNIVERAVFAGIITEENKQLYLSAIDEENDSDLSELESRLNSEEARNQTYPMKEKSDNFDPLLKPSYFKNDENSLKEMHTFINKTHLNDCHSFISEDSIENNSILDLKHAKNKETEVQETDSDASLTRQMKNGLKSNRKIETSRGLLKVMKKPRKNQVIDLDVPIYIDAKKKSTAKPCVTESNIFAERGVSNICFCKKDTARIHEGKQAQNIRKSIFPKTNFSVTKTENDDPSSSVNDLLKYKKTNKRNVEVSLDRLQEADKSTKCKSVHTFTLQKESSDFYKTEPTINSKVREEELNGHQCHCLNELQACSLQRFEAPQSIKTQEHKYRIRLKKPLNLASHQKSFNAEKVSNASFLRRVEKCKYCECDDVCKTLKVNPNDNLAETASEDKASLSDIPLKKSRQDKDCDRFLNVNIICQFYPDNEEKRIINGEDPNIKSVLTKAQTKSSKNNDVKLTTETSKTKQSKKINRLSKIFTNMKINRRQKQPGNDMELN